MSTSKKLDMVVVEESQISVKEADFAPLFERCLKSVRPDLREWKLPVDVVAAVAMLLTRRIVPGWAVLQCGELRPNQRRRKEINMQTNNQNSKLLKPVIAACLLVFLGTQHLNAQVYSFHSFDGAFSFWTFTSAGSGGGSGMMSLQTSGGNPGACLNVTTMTGDTHTGSGITESGWGIGVNPDWTVTQPLSGDLFTLQFDVLSGPGSFGQGQSVGLMVEQGSAYYLDIVSTPVTGYETSWTTESFEGNLDAGNFRLQAGSGPSQPDFGGATPTTFGFTAFNGDSGNLTQYYDNLSLSVIPEPSTCALGVGLGGLLACLSSHRRRARNCFFRIWEM